MSSPSHWLCEDGAGEGEWNRSTSLDGEHPITAGSGYTSQIGNPVAHWDG